MNHQNATHVTHTWLIQWSIIMTVDFMQNIHNIQPIAYKFCMQYNYLLDHTILWQCSIFSYNWHGLRNFTLPEVTSMVPECWSIKNIYINGKLNWHYFVIYTSITTFWKPLTIFDTITRWCQYMTNVSSPMALCEGNQPIAIEILSQRTNNVELDVFFIVSLSKLSNKQLHC